MWVFFHNDIKPDRTFKYRLYELVTRNSSKWVFISSVINYFYHLREMWK